MEKTSEQKFSEIGRLSFDLFMATGGQHLELYHLSRASRQAAKDMRLEKENESQR